VPSLAILIYLKVKGHKLTVTNITPMLLASLLNAIRLFFYFAGYTYTSISKAVILLYTWPIFATLFSIIFLRESFDRKKLLLLLTSFTGVIIINLDSDITLKSSEFLGIASIMLSAIIYSLTIIIFKKQSEKFSRWETVFYQNILGTFIYFPFLFINTPFPDFNQITVASIYALLIGVLGFGMFFSALQKIKASTASFLTYIEVVSAIVLGIIFFNESLTIYMVIGGMMIILSATFIDRE